MSRLALVVLLLGALTSTARAERPTRLAILPTVVVGPGQAATAPEIFQALARTAAPIVDLEVVSKSELVVGGTEDLEATVRACASDAACIARALAAQDVDLGLRAIVNLALEPPLVSLRLVAASPARVIGEALTELGPSDDVLAVTARECAALFDRAGFVRSGTLVVEVDPPDAVVHVEGPARAAARPGAFSIAPGTWTVVAEREGRTPARASVTVEAARETKVVFTLQTPPSLVSSPWFWAAVGLGLAGTGAAIFAATRPHDVSSGCLCITFHGGTCPPCP